MKRYIHLTLIVFTALQLSACATTGSSLGVGETKPSAIETARSNARITTPLPVLEKRYKNDPDNVENALIYAKALRQNDFKNQAETILMPFAREKETAPGVKAEMAAIQLALGNFDSAEEFGKQAIRQDPKDYLAYQNLGIALDAKQMHPEAERAFRKALENWQGDPTIIMNNLALNLASQNFIDEAVEILEKAKALQPNRIELERNLRIVRTMKER